MTTVFERKGTKLKVGKVTAEIPETVLGLAIIGMNHVDEGDRFDLDGYVYQNGVRGRKWFSSFGGTSRYFWEPVFKDIGRIERTLTRLQSRSHQLWTAKVAIFEEIKAASSPTIQGSEPTWIVHARPTHTFAASGLEDPWWAYDLRETSRGFTYGHDWVEKPEKPKLHELGQRFYKTSQYAYNVYGRVGWVRSVLLRAIQIHIRESAREREQGQIFKYNINGRSYWLHAVGTRWGGEEIEWLSNSTGFIEETIG